MQDAEVFFVEGLGERQPSRNIQQNRWKPGQGLTIKVK
jgi:hypothetical protein